MTHPDQHRLELYVLGGISNPAEEAEIRSHLAACSGCTSLEREIRSFYEAVDEEDRRVPLEEAGERHLARVARSIESISPVQHGPLARFADRAPISWLRDVAIRFPVATGLTGGAGLLAAVLAVFFSLSGGLKDTNPSYAKLNSSMGRLEVYNREDRELWFLPVGASGMKTAADLTGDHSPPWASVEDLDGDGRNEVITALGDIGSYGRESNVLRVFDADKRLRKSFVIDDSVRYRDRRYAAINGITFYLVANNPSGTGKALYVAGNNGRSPSVIVRIDPSGKVVGRFWHFGLISSGFVQDIDGDGIQDLLLAGKNDVGDSVGAAAPVLLCIDPRDLIGTRSSAATPGFTGTEPLHEKRYFVIPPTILDRVNGISNRGVRNFYRIKYEGGDGFALFTHGSSRNNAPVFEYVFSPTLELVEVKREDHTVELFNALVREGKLTGAIDEKYLRSVRDSVVVHDSKGWHIVGSPPIP